MNCFQWNRLHSFLDHLVFFTCLFGSQKEHCVMFLWPVFTGFFTTTTRGRSGVDSRTVKRSSDWVVFLFYFVSHIDVEASLSVSRVVHPRYCRYPVRFRGNSKHTTTRKRKRIRWSRFSRLQRPCLPTVASFWAFSSVSGTIIWLEWLCFIRPDSFYRDFLSGIDEQSHNKWEWRRWIRFSRRRRDRNSFGLFTGLFHLSSCFKFGNRRTNLASILHQHGLVVSWFRLIFVLRAEKQARWSRLSKPSAANTPLLLFLFDFRGSDGQKQSHGRGVDSRE